MLMFTLHDENINQVMEYRYSSEQNHTLNGQTKVSTLHRETPQAKVKLPVARLQLDWYQDEACNARGRDNSR